MRLCLFATTCLCLGIALAGSAAAEAAGLPEFGIAEGRWIELKINDGPRRTFVCDEPACRPSVVVDIDVIQENNIEKVRTLKRVNFRSEKFRLAFRAENSQLVDIRKVDIDGFLAARVLTRNQTSHSVIYFIYADQVTLSLNATGDDLASATRIAEMAAMFGARKLRMQKQLIGSN